MMLAILFIVGIGVAFILIFLRVARVETELKNFKDNQRMAHLEAINKEAGTEARLGGVEAAVSKLAGQVDKITALLEENVVTLKDLILRHQDRLDKMENYWIEFWKTYKIEKK